MNDGFINLLIAQRIHPCIINSIFAVSYTHLDVYKRQTLDGPKKLKVTLNLKKDDSKIKIAGNLDMEYTGKPITPIIDKSGSGGEITFTYEKWNGDSWQAFHSVPTHAGTYTIQAHLAEDDFYNEADSEKMQFTISRATNSWKERPIINGWIYGCLLYTSRCV